MQGLLRSKDDGIGERLHLLYIEPVPGRNTEASSLSRRIKSDPSMVSEKSPFLIKKSPWLLGGRRFLLKEGSIVAVTDEADFLAFLQLVCGKAQGLCLFPYVRLLHAPHWKKKASEPRLTKTVEEIALILFGISCSLKSRQSFGFVDTHVVTGGYKIKPARVRKVDETLQFDALIAPDTGIGCGAFEIAGNEVVDHTGTKGLSGVDHLVRNLQCLRDIPGNADLAAPAFLPALRNRNCFVFVLPNLKRDAVNVKALASQERCCDRAIHSPAHA
jgi:hypothetical protein